MKFKRYTGITWSTVELSGLIEDPDSLVSFERTRKHFGLHPFHMNDLSAAVNEILTSKLNVYDRELRGFVLAYKNPRLVEPLGEVLYDSCFIHVNVEVDLYVFRPETGCSLKGLVNKKGTDHIGVLVHKAFNVSIPRNSRRDEEEEAAEGGWIGERVSTGQEIRFTLTEIDPSTRLPIMRAVLNKRDYLSGCKLAVNGECDSPSERPVDQEIQAENETESSWEETESGKRAGDGKFDESVIKQQQRVHNSGKSEVFERDDDEPRVRERTRTEKRTGSTAGVGKRIAVKLDRGKRELPKSEGKDRLAAELRGESRNRELERFAVATERNNDGSAAITVKTEERTQEIDQTTRRTAVPTWSGLFPAKGIKLERCSSTSSNVSSIGNSQEQYGEVERGITDEDRAKAQGLPEKREKMKKKKQKEKRMNEDAAMVGRTVKGEKNLVVSEGGDLFTRIKGNETEEESGSLFGISNSGEEHRGGEKRQGKEERQKRRMKRQQKKERKDKWSEEAKEVNGAQPGAEVRVKQEPGEGWWYDVRVKTEPEAEIGLSEAAHREATESGAYGQEERRSSPEDAKTLGVSSIRMKKKGKKKMKEKGMKPSDHDESGSESRKKLKRENYRSDIEFTEVKVKVEKN